MFSFPVATTSIPANNISSLQVKRKVAPTTTTSKEETVKKVKVDENDNTTNTISNGDDK